MVDKIVVKTNGYARIVLPHLPPETAKTKEGCNWKDVDRSEIRGCPGICILMGCKKFQAKDTTGCMVTPSFTVNQYPK